MSDSQGSLPVCVHCGTARPADEPVCPTCGRPWVDSTVEEAAAANGGSAADDPSTGADAEPPAEEHDAVAVGATAAAAAGSDDTGEFTFDDWTLPPEKPRSKAIWAIPIVLLIGVAIVWGMVFLDNDTSTTTTVEAQPTTTTEPATTTSSTTSSTTSTTSSTTTTTTVPYPLPTDWEPVGEPIPTDELTLKAAGIGPLEFGTDIADIAGRLTASLGEAALSGIEGLCGPEEGYWLQWGDLQATFDGYDETSTFVSYRYEDVGLDSDLDLTTLSGLALGDTVATLKQIYASFTIAFEVIDGRDHFRLLDGAELLLWGPVSSTEDDGIVEGIYSPSPCDT